MVALLVGLVVGVLLHMHKDKVSALVVGLVDKVKALVSKVVK